MTCIFPCFTGSSPKRIHCIWFVYVFKLETIGSWLDTWVVRSQRGVDRNAFPFCKTILIISFRFTDISLSAKTLQQFRSRKIALDKMALQHFRSQDKIALNNYALKTILTISLSSQNRSQNKIALATKSLSRQNYLFRQ